jgi:hypothetical protein
MHDFTTHDLSTRTDVDADLHAGTTARPDNLTLQPPGNTRLVEDLQTVSGPVDMQVKAFAAMVALDI